VDAGGEQYLPRRSASGTPRRDVLARRLDSTPASLYQSRRLDRARNAGKTPEKPRVARQPREMLMPRSFNAERVSNKFGLLIGVGYDRFRGVLAPKAAIGRLNIVSIPG